MEILSYKKFKEIIYSNIPIELKIHIFESDLSELIYSFWCRVTGGRFKRKTVNYHGLCILVTKKGFHPISTVVGLFKGHTIEGITLEAYKRGCCGPKTPIVYRTMFYHWWLKYVDPKKISCEECGRPYEVQEDDIKIVGKF